MSQLEAWLVTALGMGVVFIGLMLCIAAINFFNRLARRIKWEGGHGEAETPVTTNSVQALPSPPEVIEPEVLAVIAATLEIDRRLYQGRQGQRLTLRRTDA